MADLPLRDSPSWFSGHFDDGAVEISATHWKSLRYFLFYRFFIAWILLTFLFLQSSPWPLVFSVDGAFIQVLAILSYLAVTGFSLATLRSSSGHFNLQLSLHVLVDVVIFSFLIHVSDEMRNALGVIMLASLAGACLVGHGILVLFYAALATVAIFLGDLIKTAIYGFDIINFFQSGVFSACFFGVGISARLIARRLIANELLAQRQEIALKNQMRVNQRIIEEMQDGALVLDQNGDIKQHNPRAGYLLGLGEPPIQALGNHAPELAERFFSWRRARPENEMVLFRVKANGMNLSARFIPTESLENDVLVLLEDTERLQERARQLKLAALGRLTANIAHEIRNPLSAINHAGALLDEKNPGERLTRIILDNVKRVDRIVSNVLELGHRDKIFQEALDLRLILPNLVEEYDDGNNRALEIVHFEISGQATLLFDRVHFHQVMWNLLGNALRYSQKKQGSVRLIVYDSLKENEVCLHVRDDGPGIDPGFVEQIFEPFFTTHSKGTGLGLYIARELCEANGIRLRLLSGVPGADFCISGKATNGLRQG